MKKLLLFIVLFLLLGCEKEEEVLEPIFEISLNEESFDPRDRYAQIKTFGGSKLVDGNLRKIFILYLQVDDGEIRLDRQHFALYCLDYDANDDGCLLYTSPSPRDRQKSRMPSSA